MSVYLLLRRWVDATWISNHKLLFLPVVIVWLVMLLAFGDAARTFFALVLLSVITAAWVGFISWRGYRLGRATTTAADRVYDRKTKYSLSKEYWDTESATAALRRKRKKDD